MALRTALIHLPPTRNDAAAEALLARRLDLQERQRQANALLDMLWLQSQQLCWQRESELSGI